MDKVAFFNKYTSLVSMLLYFRNCFHFHIKVKGKNNVIKGKFVCLGKNVKINIIGDGNIIQIGKFSTLTNLTITIYGNDNNIFIGERCYLNGCSFVTEDNENKISIGNHTYIYNDTELSAIEGTDILIGEDCLISSEVKFRTGDSHSIINITNNMRVNLSENINIDEHVWIGNRCIILKGSNIEKNCVVGTGTIMTNSLKTKENSLIVGVPAKIIKDGINWSRERIKNESR